MAAMTVREWLMAIMAVIVLAVPYVIILALVGFGIATMAADMASDLAASLGRPAPASYPTDLQILPLSDRSKLGLGSLLIGLVLMGLLLPKIDLSDGGKAKLHTAIEVGTDWIIKLAELILIAAVFQLAAEKMHAWPMKVLAVLLFVCLALHSLKPVARFVIWPVMAVVPTKRWIGAALGVIVFFGVLALNAAIVAALAWGLQGLLDSGIAGL
jgi:hypothetical protein